MFHGPCSNETLKTTHALLSMHLDEIESNYYFQLPNLLLAVQASGQNTGIAGRETLCRYIFTFSLESLPAEQEFPPKQQVVRLVLPRHFPSDGLKIFWDIQKEGKALGISLVDGGGTASAVKTVC